MEKKRYKHLRYEDRVVIYKLWKLGVPQASIARNLSCPRSKICRELSWLSPLDRNKTFYELAQEAHTVCMTRKRRVRSEARRLDPQVWTIVASKLIDERWSPENIALWLKDNLPEMAVSHQAIYDYIEKEKPEWKEYLRRKGKRPRYGKKARPGKKQKSAAAPKTPLKLRPEHINKRMEIGHWEVDTVGSTSKSTLLILTERLTRHSLIAKIPDKTAQSVKEAIIALLSQLPYQMRLSLTYDNGAENASHFQLDQILNTTSFFCEPYRSWEKGSVENRIGVVRIFFPKGTNFDLVSDDEVATLQYKLNYRPMKLLGGRFPVDVFNEFSFLFNIKLAA